MKIGKSGIYRIRNLTNNKFYIGSAVNLNKRKNQHFHYLRNNKHHNKPLQNSWNKHGSDVFKFTILCNCEIIELKLKGRYERKRYLRTLDSCRYRTA